MNLLKLTGFEKYLPFFSEENARKIFGAKNPKLVVQPEFNFSDEYTDLVNFLGASDQELFPKPWTKSEFNMHYHEFLRQETPQNGMPYFLRYQQVSLYV